MPKPTGLESANYNDVFQRDPNRPARYYSRYRLLGSVAAVQGCRPRRRLNYSPHINSRQAIHCRIHKRRDWLVDCDNDGKLDIIVANGSTIDHFRQGGDPMITLYHQDAGFKFTDITQSAGLTRKGWGMGVAIADYDNDGLPDIYVTGYSGNALYHN